MVPDFVGQQHIADMPGSAIIMGIPHSIMVFICVQQAMKVAIIAGSMHVISQHNPSAIIVQFIFASMHGSICADIIMGMVPMVVQQKLIPPHVHSIGMPQEAIAAICWQQAMNVAFMAGSMARSSMVMPVPVMVHVMLAIMHDIGIAGAVPICAGIIPIAPIPGIIIGSIVIAGVITNLLRQSAGSSRIRV